jgi:hypothetical protein
MEVKQPFLLKGNYHGDHRGVIKYNNEFDLSNVKRVYSIANKDSSRVRGFQGHLIEKRWFTATAGEFEVRVVNIMNWPEIDKKQKPFTFKLDNSCMDILCVPAGFMTCIEQIGESGSLMVFADYFLGEVDDEYRLDLDYFTKS